MKDTCPAVHHRDLETGTVTSTLPLVSSSPSQGISETPDQLTAHTKLVFFSVTCEQESKASGFSLLMKCT